MPHSALTAARPPSVVIRMTGHSTPVWRISRVRARMWARSRRPSMSRASDFGRVEQGAGLGGQDADVVGEQAQCRQDVAGGAQ